MKTIRYVSVLLLSVTVFYACSGDGDDTAPPRVEGEDGVEVEVLEYRPAPGQFINKTDSIDTKGEVVNLTTMEEANRWAEKRMKKGGYVSLGSFGGYIVVKMPKTIANRNGYDFGIMGNPFDGSSEPGIVWVMEDANGNGLADDTWYELSGSDNTEKNYSVTYYRPDEPGAIEWTDSNGDEGVVEYLPDYHTQMYYPLWIKEDSYTLTGSKLQPRTVEEPGRWENKSFGWGYADNMGSDIAKDSRGGYRYNQFEIDNAIDSNGNPVNLTQIHFVKVQCAILQNAGILGEVSTEILGFKIF